ncbi:Uncharacterised protein [Mycobacteroides abscessus subsp. massiliense]|nr:Uncharacterised protein [Mycobacteroides abscessus subsp. massiliense]
MVRHEQPSPVGPGYAILVGLRGSRIHLSPRAGCPVLQICGEGAVAFQGRVIDRRHQGILTVCAHCVFDGGVDHL